MTVGSSFLAEDIAEFSVLFVKYVRVYGKIHQRPVSSSSFRHFHASRAFFTYKLAKGRLVVVFVLCFRDATLHRFTTNKKAYRRRSKKVIRHEERIN